MPSDLSKYLGNLICGWMTGTDMPSAPAAVYVALYNGDPKASGTEVTTTLRPSGRVAADWDSFSVDGSDNSITNDAVIDFGNADAGATVSHAALVDAASSGNVLASHAITGGTKVIAAGSAVKYQVGDLVFAVGS